MRSPFFPIWPATAILFLVSPLFARGSLDVNVVAATLANASILAIASMGQTLVVQQRGLDLSIPGMISLATVLVTVIPRDEAGLLVPALGVVVLACAAAGLVSGIAVTRFGVTPLIATLGVNALLIGTVLQITSGTSTAIAADALDSFAFGRTAGLPNTFLVAVVLLTVVSIVMRRSIPGRRFVAVGASPRAALAAGIRVRRYQVAAYVASGVFAAIAGILLAGYVGTPSRLAGDSYLLPTIAAVVLGGTSLAGGNGSVVATAVGAFFLDPARSRRPRDGCARLGPARSISGSIIALGMAVRRIDRRRLFRRQTRQREEVVAGP